MKTNDLSNKAKRLPISYLLSEKVPYKSYTAITKSNRHQTNIFQVQKFYKPICLL